jgi:hypothetical protein
MRQLIEYGVIVKVPKVYITAMMHESHLGYWPSIIKLIQAHTDIELPDKANMCTAFDIECREEFETNSLLVRISTLEQIPGLYEMVPGNNFVHVTLRVCNERENDLIHWGDHGIS